MMHAFDDGGDVLVLGVIVLLPLAGVALLTWLAHCARRSAGRSKGWVVLCGNLLVLGVMLSALLLVCECYYRFWCDTTDSFGLSRVTKRWFERHYQLNASGIRDNVPEYEKRLIPGRRRITFLGDSFTAGHGIADVDDRFANGIRRRQASWEVHALAMNGLDTGAELELLRGVLAQGYELDQVVLVYSLNDIADLDPAWQAILQRIYEGDKPGFLVAHSFCLDTLYYRFKAWRDPDISDYYHFVLKAYQGPLWEEQQRRLTTLRDLVVSKGGRLLVVTFPFLHQLGARYEYGPVHDRLGAMWRELGVPHLDLLPLYSPHFRAGLVVSRHDAHPNRHAHALAAGAVEGFLKEQIELDSKHAP